MPKVDLDKVELGFSELTDEVYIGTLTPNGLWRNKRNFKNSFLNIVIRFYEGKTEIVRSGSSEWEITVKKSNNMYYKVDLNSKLYTTLKDVQLKMKEANKAALKLANELGFKKWRGSNNFVIAGGIVSLYAETKPEGYVYTYGSKESLNDFFPKKCKANKEILDKINSLPTVDSFSFTDQIKYDWRQHKSPTGNTRGGNHVLFTPGLSFPKNGEILISFPEYIKKYKPVAGMIEITFTEHKILNK